MIVPPGEASKTIALTNCNGGLQTASLVVNAVGDMILNGAPSGTTTVSELLRVNYATADFKYLTGSNSIDGQQVRIQMMKDSDELRASTYGAGNFVVAKSSLPALFSTCSLAGGTASYALTSLPSSQRYASVFTNGVTGIDNTIVASGTFTGGVATWDNLIFGNSLSLNDQPIRYVSLDISSGAIATSASPTGPFATTLITVPTTPTSTYAYFEEEMDGTEKYLTIEMARGSGLQDFSLYVERVGNLLKPIPQQQQPAL